MSREKATAEIAKKESWAKNAGLGLGAKLGNINDSGSGGFVQEFEHARIYWHANTGAHEVHGSILARYIELGGPGAHPQTGKRELGYPVADEERGLLGMEVSRFEFGTIYNIHGHRCVGVYGAFAGSDVDDIGLPVSEPIRVPGGQALYGYEGCLFVPDAAPRTILRAVMNAPQMGSPALIAQGTDRLPMGLTMEIPLSILHQLQGSQQDDVGTDLMAIFEGLWDDRLLVETVRSGKIVPVRTTADVAQTGIEGAGATPRLGILVRWRARITDRSRVPDRTLMNLRLTTPGSSAVIAAHAYYTAPSWEEFGFLHATDLHVSRRAELFRDRLKNASRNDSAQMMVNPNDSVRTLFNYANGLHTAGLIDFMILTGDLVDYIFERGDDHKGGGNFRYLERLIMGQAPSGDDEVAANDELHVPIYTVLGNHDYVVNPYRLTFEIDLTGPSTKVVNKWHGFNLVREDADVLEGGSRPTITEDAALHMAISDREATHYYLRRINRDTTYTVGLGDRHRLVMVDTGRNADTVEGKIDGIQQWLEGWGIGGGANEEETNFKRGTPSSTSPEYPQLERGLEGSRPPGVVIIGMHNPPLNTDGNEYPHYFRETERPHFPKDQLQQLIISYFARAMEDGSTPLQSIARSWPTTGTPHFKEGNLDELLDFGIVKWTDRDEEDFLALCLTKGVDAIFCGHIHERVECRIKPNQDGGFLFFTDFYTENPRIFRESRDWGGGNTDKRPIHITIAPDAEIGATPRIRRDKRSGNGTIESRELDVPPYADPLNASDDKDAWWDRHRPLILQTACIGPIDSSQRGARPGGGNTIPKRHVSMQGIRWVRVTGDSISRIHYVEMADIRAGTPPITIKNPVVSPEKTLEEPGTVVRPPDQTNPPKRPDILRPPAVGRLGNEKIES